MGEWISIQESKPSDGAYVLCYVNDIVSGWVELLKYEGKGVWVDAINADEYDPIVTHWMPLPEPPKDE